MPTHDPHTALDASPQPIPPGDQAPAELRNAALFDPGVPLKRCTKCGEWKPAIPLTFYRSQSEKCGFMSRCKECCSRAAQAKRRTGWKAPRLTRLNGKVCAGCGEPLVGEQRKFCSIGCRDKPGPLSATARCPHCGEWKPRTPEFFHRNAAQRSGFSNRCKKCRANGDVAQRLARKSRLSGRQCQGCGRPLNVDQNQFCGLSCWAKHRPPFRVRRGPSHPSWKGGKITNGGYLYLRYPAHPKANRSGYIPAHWIAYEKHVGAPPGMIDWGCKKGQFQVHHRNGNRADNRPQNLERRRVGHPAGTSLSEDLESWGPPEVFAVEMRRLGWVRADEKEGRADAAGGV